MALSILFVEVSWKLGEWSAKRVPGQVPASVSDLTDARFRAIPGERDSFYAVLSPDEAIAMARPHWERMVMLWRGSVAEGQAEEHLAHWEDVRQRCRFVIANLFEWDSGLA